MIIHLFFCTWNCIKRHYNISETNSFDVLILSYWKSWVTFKIILKKHVCEHSGSRDILKKSIFCKGIGLDEKKLYIYFMKSHVCSNMPICAQKWCFPFYLLPNRAYSRRYWFVIRGRCVLLCLHGWVWKGKILVLWAHTCLENDYHKFLSFFLI